MISDPLVSVIITTYNYGRYLQDSLESVLGQTYSAIDVIVVDDGSTDNTSEIMQAYLDRPSVRYIRMEHSGSPPFVRNTGIREAKGDYIAFLDADDMWFKQKLKEQIPLFLNNNVGVAYSRAIEVDEKGCKISSVNSNYRMHRGDVLNDIYISNFAVMSSLIIRKPCFKKAGLFDENFTRHDDYDLLVRMAVHYDFDYINEPLVKYRSHYNQFSKNIEDELNTVWAVFDKHLNDKMIKKRLFWRTPRLAKANVCKIYAAMFFSSRHRLKSIRCYIISLVQFPFFWPSWVGLVRCLLPDAIIHLRNKIIKGY